MADDRSEAASVSIPTDGTPEDPDTGVQLGRRRTRFLDDGFDAGVKIQEDGRLDMKIRQHQSSVARILDHFHRKPKPPSEPATIPEPSPAEPPSEKTGSFPLRMNIVIHVVGSRGDVQPFVALGKALKKHGHRVRLATHMAFEDFVKSNGIEFFGIGGDPEEMMAFMVRNPGLLPDFHTIRSGALRRHRGCVKTMVCGCWRSCFEPGDGTGTPQIFDDPHTFSVDPKGPKPFVADAIIANPPSFAHVHSAQKLGIPLNMMFTMPWTATQAFPHPLANIQRKQTKPSVANFVSYAIVEMIIWEGLGDIFNKFRKRELGLDPLDATQAPSLTHRLNIPFTYLWSPALLPKPDDWPDHIDICGFSFLPGKTSYTPPQDLDTFLKAGPPPIYIGFGSIVVDEPARLTKMVFDAIRETGERAIVNKGWGNLGGDLMEVPENVLMIGSCPHDWLFQHVSCVVHHGGAGTTAAGLALGRPTVVISFFGDQFFWGSIVGRSGAGPRAVPYKELTTDKLVAAIRKALEPSTRDKANEIGEQMRSESGVENAVNSFHRHLDLENLRCAVVPTKPAVWRIRHSRTKLSAVAAAVLVDARLLQPQNLVLYRPQEYDTDREPRGPLTAGAEVLVGAIASFISGFGVLPLEMLQVFTTTRTMAHCKPNRADAELPPKEREKPETTSAEESSREEAAAESETTSTEDNPQEEAAAASEATSTEDTAQEEAAVASEAEGQLQDLRAAGLETKRARAPLAKQCDKLCDAGITFNRFGRRLLNSVILLPMDFTLSLSKGFHNAPKLYHDRMVKTTRKVMGIRSGFKIAGQELFSSFYQGVTGLVMQPYTEAQRSGSKGFFKGIGKGLGGVFLKPAAGLWGLAGYPLNGLHINLRRSLSKSKKRHISASRIVQGMEEMFALSDEERTRIIKAWKALGEKAQNGPPEEEGLEILDSQDVYS